LRADELTGLVRAFLLEPLAVREDKRKVDLQLRDHRVNGGGELDGAHDCDSLSRRGRGRGEEEVALDARHQVRDLELYLHKDVEDLPGAEVMAGAEEGGGTLTVVMVSGTRQLWPKWIKRSAPIFLAVKSSMQQAPYVTSAMMITCRGGGEGEGVCV
jgi:hypothetical protein